MVERSKNAELEKKQASHIDSPELAGAGAVAVAVPESEGGGMYARY
jgi:hypothetical protein